MSWSPPYCGKFMSFNSWVVLANIFSWVLLESSYYFRPESCGAYMWPRGTTHTKINVYYNTHIFGCHNLTIYRITVVISGKKICYPSWLIDFCFEFRPCLCWELLWFPTRSWAMSSTIRSQGRWKKNLSIISSPGFNPRTGPNHPNSYIFVKYSFLAQSPKKNVLKYLVLTCLSYYAWGVLWILTDGVWSSAFRVCLYFYVALDTDINRVPYYKTNNIFVGHTWMSFRYRRTNGV